MPMPDNIFFYRRKGGGMGGLGVVLIFGYLVLIDKVCTYIIAPVLGFVRWIGM
ncbi:MAG: hypothetical protein IPP47_06945 [Bryobacterales bacterium]|nr:hypothetical protein [Bryobacterales bacterium]